MEARDQPAAVSNQQPGKTDLQAPTTQQQPIQDGTVAAQEAPSMRPLAATQPGEQSVPGPSGIFSNQDAYFPSQQATNSNGTFPPAGVMISPGQPSVGQNGATAEQRDDGNAISADDIALYDRQIRLWGMKAQKRIQNANVLLITMKALANEIAKNLVLAGIGSLTLVDDQNVIEADLGAQFLSSEQNIGQKRAEAVSGEIQKLNPRVKVVADSGSIMTKGVSYFSAFDIVIATDLNPTTLAFINTATRLHNRQFYAAGTHGFYGYIFCDLIEHDFVLQREMGEKGEKGKKGYIPASVGQETRTRVITDVKTKEEGNKTFELVAKREYYSTWDLASETSVLPAEYYNQRSTRRLRAVTPALSCLRALWAFQQMHDRNPAHNRQDLEFFTKSATQCHAMLSLPGDTLTSEFLRSFLQNIGSEIGPVTAILGGQLAQDVINVLGHSQQPIQNMVIFDGNKMEASQYALHPEGSLGRAQLEISNPMNPNPMQPMMHMMPVGDPQMGHQQMGHPDMLPMDQTNVIPGGGV